MQVWNVLHAAHWKYRTQTWRKNSPSAHHRTTLLGYIFETKVRIDNRKNVLNSNTSPTCPYNMVNFSPLAAEIGSLLWGIPANFNRFRVLAALLHCALVLGISQTLWHWTEPIFSRAAITLGIGAHSSLWSPYVIGQTIYIFILFLLSSFFFFA